MKTTAIICEFNPLHTGHKKLIDHAKTISDKVICIMSGNFTQRGLPACADKYSRAKHAIFAGADLVVELPTIYATASAENFAWGGATIADRLHADSLLFGSECGDIDKLKNCATLLDDKLINESIVRELTKGVSYPKAVAIATNSDVLEKPNNVLAVEYIRALKKIDSNIEPITVKREDNYNGAPDLYASSSSLRNDKSLRKQYSYDFVIKDVDDSVEAKFGEIATGVLSLYDKDTLQQIEGVTEGLENRIFNADKSKGYDALLEQLKTKRYTRLKLQRVVLNTVLAIKKADVAQSKTKHPLIKILAVKADSLSMLSGIENINDELTKKADRLYYAMSGKKAPDKLLKIDCQ